MPEIPAPTMSTSKFSTLLGAALVTEAVSFMASDWLSSVAFFTMVAIRPAIRSPGRRIRGIADGIPAHATSVCRESHEGGHGATQGAGKAEAAAECRGAFAGV